MIEVDREIFKPLREAKYFVAGSISDVLGEEPNEAGCEEVAFVDVLPKENPDVLGLAGPAGLNEGAGAKDEPAEGGGKGEAEGTEGTGDPNPKGEAEDVDFTCNEEKKVR